MTIREYEEELEYEQEVADSKPWRVRDYLRWWLMPGFNLFTRRRVRLQQYWRTGARSVLDAGFGNGWFSYLAYLSGAVVTAVNCEPKQVEKAQNFYHHFLQVPTDKLSFCRVNLYVIESLARTFDEIICYETLEHIVGDQQVCAAFFRLLNPGGVLHLCCPFAEHPHWQAEKLDLQEAGGHVRAGYTLDSYRALLEPLGFRLTAVEGVGGKWLVRVHLLVFAVQKKWGAWPAYFLAFCFLPFVLLDRSTTNTPYCLYVQATKPGPKID